MNQRHALVSLLVAGILTSNNIQASHTFFTPRQITTDPTFELALTDYLIYNPVNNNNLQLSIKPFYQHSVKPQETAEFLLPNNKSCATVREQGTGDINPLWFNVIGSVGTYYNSTLSLKPSRATFGAVLTFYANLDVLADGLWILINTAVMGASHKVDANEKNRVGRGTIPGFENLCDAFNNPIWYSGKITCCDTTKKKGGLDDIQVKLGYDLFMCDNGHIAPYAVCTIPTGDRPRSKYLFEPLVGSKHGSLGAGLNTEYTLCQESNYHTSILGDFKYRYVFAATECRSFDLCNNGDWSRYLLLATQNQPLDSFSGINYFTLPAKVTPRSTIDFWLAAHHQYCNWDVEIGYTLWWRQKERIKLSRCANASPLLSNNIGIYDMAGVCTPPAISASTARINESFVNNSIVSDTTFIPVTFNQINLSSAKHPQALSNKVYLAGSWRYDATCHSALFGLGSSYEIASNKNALNQWAVWANIGLDF